MCVTQKKVSSISTSNKSNKATYLKIILLTLHVATWLLIVVVVNDFFKCVFAKFITAAI